MKTVSSKEVSVLIVVSAISRAVSVISLLIDALSQVPLWHPLNMEIHGFNRPMFVDSSSFSRSIITPASILVCMGSILIDLANFWLSRRDLPRIRPPSAVASCLFVVAALLLLISHIAALFGPLPPREKCHSICAIVKSVFYTMSFVAHAVIAKNPDFCVFHLKRFFFDYADTSASLNMQEPSPKVGGRPTPQKSLKAARKLRELLEKMEREGRVTRTREYRPGEDVLYRDYGQI